MSTDREQLIEEAAKAIHADYIARYAEEPPVYHAGIGQPVWRHIARAAFAVFEKAHTPSLSLSDAHSSSVSVSEAHTPSAEQTEVGVINYCPFHGDLLNMPDDGRDTRSERCRNAHSLIELRAARRIDTPTGDEREALEDTLRREFEYRIRTAVAYGAMKGFREIPSQVRADWIQHEIAGAMASRAVAGFRCTVQGEPSGAQVTAAMVAYEGHATRVEAWRAALRAAGVVSVQGEPEWEYGSALVSDPDKASPLPSLQEANESVSAWNESVRRMDRQGRANSGPAFVVLRRSAGPWVPVQAPEGMSDAEG